MSIYKTIYLDNGDKAYLLFTVPKKVVGEWGYQEGSSSRDKHFIQRVMGLATIPAIQDKNNNSSYGLLTDPVQTELLQEEIYEGEIRDRPESTNAGWHAQNLADRVKTLENKEEKLKETIKSLEEQRAILVSGREDEIKPLYPLGFPFYYAGYSDKPREYKVSGYRKEYRGRWKFYLLSADGSSHEFYLETDGTEADRSSYFLTEADAQAVLDSRAEQRKQEEEKRRIQKIAEAKRVLEEEANKEVSTVIIAP